MRVLSLFTGAMGLDIGMEQHGFKTIVAVEQDHHAQTTIRTNRPDVKVFDDVFSLNLQELEDNFQPFDVIAGGPPCQSWSYAGKQMGMEDHRGLCIPRFLDIVDRLRPQFVVMENVMGLATASIDNVKGAMPPYISKRLLDSGYISSCNEVNSADFGSPQCRKRIVFLAARNIQPVLVPTHAKFRQPDLFMTTPELPPWKTLRDAIGNMNDPEDEWTAYGESQLKYLKLLKAGQDWRDLPKDLQKAAMGGAINSSGGRTSYFRRLSWGKPSPTLVCCPVQKSTCLCHPEQNRPLSVREYARIQGFPDNWKFCGPTSAKYKQIGNAVPVQLAEAIGKAIMTTQKGIS